MFVNKPLNDDIFFVCSAIEAVGRDRKMHVRDVVKHIGVDGLRKLYKAAPVQHCLTMEQTVDEICEDYNIEFDGSFDCVGRCKYKVPSIYEIGQVLAQLICNVLTEGDMFKQWYNILQTDYVALIFDYNTAMYYTNTEQMACEFLEEYSDGVEF